MNTCPKCGSDMIGDGYTSVIHCENVEDDELQYLEPDAIPIVCNFEDPESDGDID